MTTNSTINNLKERLNNLGNKLSQITAGTINLVPVETSSIFTITSETMYIPANSYFKNGSKIVVDTATNEEIIALFA